MDVEKTVTFYLDPVRLADALDGKINIINLACAAFGSRGFGTAFLENSDIEMLQSAQRPGYAMFHLEHPFHDRAMTMRPSYILPFWRIEKTGKRWETRVANARFDPGKVDPHKAKQFARYWRDRLFGGDATNTRREPFIYVPLQGRLTEHRSFQTTSPIAMLEATLAQNPSHRVVATLHPGETYLTPDRDALDNLLARHSRLTVATGLSPKVLLRDCDFVVTQNSSLAFEGFLFRKPCVLFAQIDFHHIAVNVSDHDHTEAFRQVREVRPDYDAYLYWFLQMHSINAGRDDAKQRILEQVRLGGWAM